MVFGNSGEVHFLSSMPQTQDVALAHSPRTLP